MRVAVLALAVLSAGCGYFNSMYNAQRRFGEAERAAARGDRAAAETAWRETIDRAAGSLRRDPDGRWSDDALLLVGRSHFGLGQYDRAAAALARVVEDGGDAAVRAEARLWLGASVLELARPAEALIILDSARASLADDDMVARARLWRGRALVALERYADAWPDLDAAGAARNGIGVAARLDIAAAAIAADDSARFTATVRASLDSDAAFAADSVVALTRVAAGRWSPAFAAALLEAVDGAPMSSDARDRLRLERADLAAATGDRAAAIAIARSAAAGRGPTADQARVRIARWRLRDATEPADLADARADLGPAPAAAEARALHGSIVTAELLLERAAAGDQPLALYAVAELARDELDAPGLARRLFLAYADAAAGAAWAAKAALAAAALGADSAIVQPYLRGGAGNVYVALLHGPVAGDAFADSERRLAEELAAVRAEAVTAAATRAPDVGRTPGSRVVGDTFPAGSR